MRRIISIANQKGGVGKTTTAAALSVLLARTGQPVHMLDMDPQASLTNAFGISDPEGRLYEAMSFRRALPVERITENLTITPSSIDLARGETQFVAETAREYLLKSCLQKSDIPEDATVIIDSPPSLGVLAVNCLTAAHGLVVVVKPGGFELRALAHLEEVIQILREQVNPDLGILGAVITDCHARRSITGQVETELARLYPVLGRVRSEAALLYATTEGRVLELTKSAALDDYAAVLERLMNGAPATLEVEPCLN
ncbi:MAG: AAA family ATPase [Isosphaeraceae bacterium]